MGGEGSMMHMINTLKNNKSMLSKRKERKALEGSYANIKLEFPNNATPQELKKLREKLQLEQKKTKQKQLLLFGLVLVIITLIFIYT